MFHTNAFLGLLNSRVVVACHDPGMLKDLCKRQTLARITPEHILKQVAGFITDGLVRQVVCHELLQLATIDLRVAKVGRIRPLEGCQAYQKDKEQDTAGPKVGRKAIKGFIAFNDFWSKIGQRPALTRAFISNRELPSETSETPP